MYWNTDRQRLPRDRHELVKKLLSKLPESERTVVTLFYLGEMTAQEIGKFLGVSVNTIKSRLRRGRKRLQEQQEELLVSETLGSIPFPAQVTERILQEVANMKPIPLRLANRCYRGRLLELLPFWLCCCSVRVPNTSRVFRSRTVLRHNLNLLLRSLIHLSFLIFRQNQLCETELDKLLWVKAAGPAHKSLQLPQDLLHCRTPPSFLPRSGHREARPREARPRYFRYIRRDCLCRCSDRHIQIKNRWDRVDTHQHGCSNW